MEVLFAMIAVPGLGFLLLLCRRQLLESGDRADRDFARRALGWLGGIALVQAIAFPGWIIIDAIAAGDHLLAGGTLLGILLCCAVGGVLWYAGRAAWRVSGHLDRPDLPVSDLSRQARDREALLLGIIGLLGLPLLLPGSLLLLVFSGFVGVEYAAHDLVQRGRQNRLLWTLALAARYGRPLADEIELLALSESAVQKSRLTVLTSTLREGTPLSQALMIGASLLPLEMAADIQAGEENGQLAGVLAELAARHTQQIRESRWEGSLNSISAYLTSITLAILAISSFQMYYIIPKFKQIFAEFGLQLPEATQLFIRFLDRFSAYWYLLLPLLTLPFVVLIQLLYVAAGRTRWVPPFVRGFWPRLTTPGVLRSLRTAAEQQGSVISVMRSLSDVTSDQATAARYDRVRRRLLEGGTLGTSLEAEQIITRRESLALQRAQILGHLAWGLEAIADRIDRIRLRRLSTLVEWLRPGVILLLGLFVLGFCVAMFMPIVKLMDDLS